MYIVLYNSLMTVKTIIDIRTDELGLPYPFPKKHIDDVARSFTIIQDGSNYRLKSKHRLERIEVRIPKYVLIQMTKDLLDHLLQSA